MNRNRLFGLITAILVVLICAAILLVSWRLLDPRQASNLDLTLVEADLKAVPFFDLVFPEDGGEADSLFLPDPIVKHRPRPLHRRGHDLLGFRNISIPSHPDIVTIGDSQTYGVNAGVRSNWPYYLGTELDKVVYNMSFGGWGGLHYSFIAEKALTLRPKLLIVALYMGNDSLENVFLVYTSDYWKEYREPSYEAMVEQVETELAPPLMLAEVPVGDSWGMMFTPQLRLRVNDTSTEIVRFGYQLQKEAIARICKAAGDKGVPVAFTIIPTKEYVYSRYIERQQIETNEPFARLIEYERANIASLVEAIGADQATYIDVIEALQQAVAPGPLIYPEDDNGHPMPEGYRIIGETIAAGAKPLLQKK